MSRNLLMLGVVATLIAGCQHASPVLIPAAPESTATIQGVSQAQPGMVFAGFRIVVDPATLTATVAPWRNATAQPPQGQVYDLDIANFQNADSLRITGVQVLGSGDFRVTFSHAHPFPAPDVSLPPTGVNRADLGYTGRLVLLTSYNPRAFFSNAVRLSAGAVLEPDGYVAVGDLLTSGSPLLVTAYPYKLLADEFLNNRVGISNGGNPEGSYATPAGGWQRANLGPEGTGWTGFDYVHGGQTITNTFTLSKEALAASNFDLEAALLIQYQDPRGAGGSTFRLPPAVIDPLQFAYRLPYATIDCSQAAIEPLEFLGPATDASVMLQVNLRDWDATAAESSDSTVGDQPNVGLIQAAASGNPAVALDAPDILTGLRNMGTPTGTGTSDDPLVYTNSLPNQQGAPAGRYYGCLRVIDPEDADPERGSYHSGVDASSLTPESSRRIPARTWQIVTIQVGPDVPAITAVTPTGIVAAVDEFLTFEATVIGSVDSVMWQFDPASVRSQVVDGTSATVQFSGQAGFHSATCTATNAAGSSAPFEFAFRLLPPIKPGFSSTLLASASVLQGLAEDQIVTVIDGRPAVLYTDSSASLRIAHSALVDPTFEDWDYYQIAEGIQGGLSVATIDGRCAVAAAQTMATGNGMYIYALTPTPTGSADWRVTQFRDALGGDKWGFQNALTEYNGRAALLSLEDTNDEFHYFRADGVNPLGDADWESHRLTAEGFQGDLAVGVFPEGERPIAVVANNTPHSVTIFSATVAEPGGLADWEPTERLYLSDVYSAALPDLAAGSQEGVVSCAVIVGSGTLSELIYLEYGAASAADLMPVTEQSLATRPLWFPNTPVKMIWHNDRLAIIYNNGQFQRPAIMRALTTNPVGAEWEEAILPVHSLATRYGVISHRNSLFLVGDTGVDTDWRWFQSDGPW